MILSGELEQVGTFNGNPLTMAAAKVNLTEVLTKDAYRELDRDQRGVPRLRRRDRAVPPPGLDEAARREGLDRLAHRRRSTSTATCGTIDDRIPQLAWLWQLNRGVFKSPGSKWESLDVVDRAHGRGRAALRRQLRGDGRRDHAADAARSAPEPG